MKSGRTAVLLFTALAFATSVTGPLRAEETATENRPDPVIGDLKPAFPAEVVKALEKAAKSNRDVVVVFNIPDWGGWCERIRKDILEKPQFAKGAEKHFVVVNLDFPRKTAGPVDDFRLRSAYAKRYRITGYPVVLLLDKAGRPYAKTGYRQETPEAYVAHLESLKATREKRDAQIDKARRNQGYIRAELMAGALGAVDASLIPDYADLFEELRAADPQDRKGVIADYDIMRLVGRVKDNVAESRNREAGLWEFDVFLSAHPELSKTRRQRVLLARFAYIQRSGEDGLSRIARCQKHLEELRDMAALDPKSPSVREINRLIESEQAQLDQLRNEG